MRRLHLTLSILFLESLISFPAFANRLETVASKGVVDISRIAQALGPIGFLIGGILYTVGNPFLGRSFLIGGSIGTGVVYGFPILISFFKALVS